MPLHAVEEDSRLAEKGRLLQQAPSSMRIALPRGAAVGSLARFLAQARRDLKSSEDLLARQLISAQPSETARTQVETFKAQAESQREQVELAQAGVRSAEVQLDYTTVC